MTRRAFPRLALGIALGATALPLAPAHAQYYTSFNWAYSFPAGDAKTFADNGSWLGFAIEGRRILSPTMSVGFHTGYTEFWENTIDTYGAPNAAITGDQYRNLATLPLLITGHFYPQTGGGLRPFIGLGAGAYWVRQYFEIGLSSVREDNWHFGLMPQVGLAIPIKSAVYTTLTATYHYPFNAGDYLGGSDMSPQYYSFGIGMAYGSPNY